MRLTKKENDKYGYEVVCDNPNTSIHQDISNAIEKLGQLEDIEEELGIDLITLFKALKNGIWIQDLMSLGIQSVSIHYSEEEGIYLYNYFFENCYDFKDYGKTWALTKEELL